jgi:uncharacterized protein
MIAAHIDHGTLRVVVRPKAARTEVVDWDDARKALIVRVKAQPEDGKANAELVRYLSKELKRRVSIKSGFSSREKMLSIG